MFTNNLTMLEHRTMIVTKASPVLPLKNCILVSTKVAYKYTPTARVSMVASYQCQLHIPSSSSMVIATITVDGFGVGLLAAAEVLTRLFGGSEDDATGVAGWEPLSGLAPLVLLGESVM
jgi:hypothetical protein